jgi:hypothetical protein
MQQWLRGNFSYRSMQGDSAPHDIGFRGSKSMMRVSTVTDSSEKLVVCVRLTKAHAQLMRETPGGADTFLEVCNSKTSCDCSLLPRLSRFLAIFRVAASFLSRLKPALSLLTAGEGRGIFAKKSATVTLFLLDAVCCCSSGLGAATVASGTFFFIANQKTVLNRSEHFDWNRYLHHFILLH